MHRWVWYYQDHVITCDCQVTQVARLLASQMTAAGIGIGAQSKGIQPQRSVSI